jgi:hypothetical protein
VVTRSIEPSYVHLLSKNNYVQESSPLPLSSHSHPRSSDLSHVLISHKDRCERSKPDRRNDRDETLGNRNDIRLDHGRLLFYRQRKDGRNRVADQVERCIGSQTCDLLIKEDGLYGIDDPDSDGSAGELEE